MNIEIVDEGPAATPDLLLITRVKAMFQNEAYHYCADCHAHCRQTILAAEATKEVSQAYDRLNSQHLQLVEALRGVRLMLNTELKQYQSEPWAQRVNEAFEAALTPKE